MLNSVSPALALAPGRVCCGAGLGLCVCAYVCRAPFPLDQADFNGIKDYSTTWAPTWIKTFIGD